MRIGIQGEKGSYHEIVAKKLYENDEIIYTDNFSEVFDNLLTGLTDLAIIAIANNRYGFIPESFSEIIDHSNEIFIIDEFYLPIKHQLLSINGATLNNIEEVYSQSAAIGQCHKFLESELPNAKITEYIDTAASAKLISELKDPKKAAIASLNASEIYKLQVIKSNIQDDPDNITRFLVIERNNNLPHDMQNNKTTAILKTSQKTGSLAEALLIFKEKDINITNLHSSFIPNTTFNMQFFIEFDTGSDSVNFENIKQKLKSIGAEIKSIGSYNSRSIKY